MARHVSLQQPCLLAEGCVCRRNTVRATYFATIVLFPVQGVVSSALCLFVCSAVLYSSSHPVSAPSFCLVCLDIGSWLQLFGFQLHNVVPGFPKPDVGRLEQTYELMKTQTKTQNWDSSKVSPFHRAVCDVVFLYGRRYPELSNNLAGRRRALGFFFLPTNTLKNLVM